MLFPTTPGGASPNGVEEASPGRPGQWLKIILVGLPRTVGRLVEECVLDEARSS